MKVKIRLKQPWNDPNGPSHAKGATIEVEQATADMLVEMDYAELIQPNVTILLKAEHDGHAAGETLELAPGVATALIGAGKAEKVAGADDIEAAFTKAAANFKGTIKQAIAEGVTEALDAIKPDGKGGIRVSGGRDMREEDPMCGFKSHNEFFLRVKECSQHGVAPDERFFITAAVDRDHTKDIDASQIAVGGEGGFAAPTLTASTIYTRARTRLGGILEKCMPIVLTNYGGVRMPGMLDHDRYTAAMKYGGIIVYNTAEGSQITSSGPLKWREIRLEPESKTALCAATQQMLSVVANFGAFLTDKMGDAIGDTIVGDVMFGNGAGIALGMFAAENAGCVEVAKEDEQVADSIVMQNIVQMETHLAEGSEESAEYWYNGEGLPQLMTMTLDVGTGGHAVYLRGNSIDGKPHSILWGRKITKTFKCKALGERADICLGDPSQYFLATRGTLRTEMSIHFLFDYDKTAFKAVMEVDGRPAWDQTLRPENSASDFRVAPWVVVAERA